MKPENGLTPVEEKGGASMSVGVEKVVGEVVQVNKAEYEALKKRVSELERELAFREERERQERIEDKRKAEAGLASFVAFRREVYKILKSVAVDFSMRENLPERVHVSDPMASEMLRRRNNTLARIHNLLDSIEWEALIFLSEVERVLGETWGYNLVKVEGMVTRVKGDELEDLYMAALSLVIQIQSMRRMLRGIIDEYVKETEIAEKEVKRR